MDIVWNYLVELRKELVETQKIRSQLIGFKITFVSAAIGIIGTNLDKIPSALLVVPAFASIFFDFLINSYSSSIKCLGHYIRNYIEPALKTANNLNDDFPLWEEFLKNERTKQALPVIGNLGLTFLATGVAIIALLLSFQLNLSVTLIILLCIFFTIDLMVYLNPYRSGKNQKNLKSRSSHEN